MAADLSDADRDLLIRTVYGEAGNQSPEGQQAVAAVALNRLKSGNFGGSMRDVLLQKNAFEPWQTRAGELNALATDAPAYQAASSAVDAALGGTDPTNGATFFLNPDVVTKRGDKMPNWASGEGQRIGDHVFYGGRVGQTDDDFLRMWGVTEQAAPVAASDDDFLKAWAVPTAASAPSTASTKTADAAETVFRKDTPFGSLETIAHDDPNWLGKLSRFGMGALRGVVDVGDTVTEGALNAAGAMQDKFFPTESGAPSSIQQLAENYARDNQALSERYDRLYGNSAAAQIGRVGGQIAGTTPLIMSGEGVLGAVAQGAGRFVPAITAAADAIKANKLFGVGGVALRGAGEGAAASGLTNSASDQSLTDDLKSGAILGAIGGTALHGVNSILFSRGGINKEVADLAAKARDKFGINIRPGQISSAPALHFLDSVVNRLPLSGGTAAREGQQVAFNRAVAQTFGEHAEKITPDVMMAAKTRLGKEFDSVAQRVSNVALDQPLVNDLVRVGRDAQDVLQPQELAPLRRQLINIANRFGKNGGITGEQYQALTRKGAPLDRLIQSTNPNVKFYASQIREALDDSLQRSAPPGVVDDLLKARRQYRAMKTVEGLAEKSTTGDVSPANLLSAVRGNYDVAYGGGGDLAELGRIGQRFLKEPPSSGTSERAGWMVALDRAKDAVAPLVGLGATAGAAATAGLSPVVGAGAYGVTVPLLGAVSRSKLIANSMIRGAQRGTSGVINRLLDQSGAPATSIIGNRLLGPQYRLNAPERDARDR
jgi:hypothetical protein